MLPPRGGGQFITNGNGLQETAPASNLLERGTFIDG